MRRADRKLGQLLLAIELGFSVPHTVMGSNWQEISSHLLCDDQPMIVKMIHGVISDQGTLKALYTTKIDRSRYDEIKESTVPFPGIYQNFVDKFREWRITLVGDRPFSAAIYTEASAKEDWRKHQLTEAVRFKNEIPPDGVEERCARFLGKMGLNFGAFDLIETHEGEIVFLECNPNGQYGWLEDMFGFPISDSVASELIKIASQPRER